MTFLTALSTLLLWFLSVLWSAACWSRIYSWAFIVTLMLINNCRLPKFTWTIRLVLNYAWRIRDVRPCRLMVMLCADWMFKIVALIILLLHHLFLLWDLIKLLLFLRCLILRGSMVIVWVGLKFFFIPLWRWLNNVQKEALSLCLLWLISPLGKVVLFVHIVAF